jgi:PhoH-like ATPase
MKRRMSINMKKNKTFVLDTNILLYDPESIESFEDNDIVIILSVLGQIDDFKNAPGELGANAREVARKLDKLCQENSLFKGVKMPGGGTLKVHSYHKVPLTINHENEVDHKILCEAKHLKDEGVDARIVTQDIVLRVKASGLDIPAEDYKKSKVKAEKYSGIRVVNTVKSQTDELAGGSVIIDEKLSPNEYVNLLSEDDGKTSVLGRHTKNGNIVLVKDHHPILNIRPKNIEQTFALDALLDDDIKLVTLQGKAGTGKTLLTVAAAIYQLQNDMFSRIVVTRPVIPVGKDIGYLPGDMNEKMQPWMKPIYDSIDMIRENDRKGKKTELPINFDNDSEMIQIAPLAYLRGRSIPHSFMIIDESQNLTPLEIKTLVTRCGEGTKMVFTGDIDQIDNPLLNAKSNGLSHLISKFKGHPLHAHVELVKGVRSKLAEAGSQIL